MLIRFAPLAVVAVSVTAADAQVVRFRAVELDALPGGLTEANAINEAGAVTGRSGSGSIDPGSHVFTWNEAGGITNLNDFGFEFSSGAVINDDGWVAGYGCTFPGQACVAAPFKCHPEHGAFLLDTLGGTNGQITGINAAGDVVGYWGTEDDETHAFLTTADGTTYDLGTLGGIASYAYAIGDAGHVAGYAWNETSYRAFVYTLEEGMVDLGTFGGATSRAWDVNAFGVVVGTAQDAAGINRAFRWTEKTGMVPLPMPPGATGSSAELINDAGVITGSWTDGATGLGGTFRWSESDGIEVIEDGEFAGFGPLGMNEAGDIASAVFDPGTYETIAYVDTMEYGHVRLTADTVVGLDWTIMQATDINDAGTILVGGFDFGGAHSAILHRLTPGDVDADGNVDVSDVIAMIAAWGTCPSEGICLADVDGDGQVGTSDLLMLLAYWGQ